MKNFEVHELVDGWTGQAGTLMEAIQLRDSIIRDHGAENVQVKITAEVDEYDLRLLEAYEREVWADQPWGR